MKTDGVERAPESEYHIAPALAARRSIIKLSEKTSRLSLLRIKLRDARRCKAIEHPKFFFSKPLVGNEGPTIRHRQPARSTYKLACHLRPQIRRAQHHFGP